MFPYCKGEGGEGLGLMSHFYVEWEFAGTPYVLLQLHKVVMMSLPLPAGGVAGAALLCWKDTRFSRGMFCSISSCPQILIGYFYHV